MGPGAPATDSVCAVWVRVLGTSQVALGDDPAAAVELGARKPRSVLAALALRLGSDVPPDALVDLVWGEDPPRGAHGTLHSYLSGVRRVLEPGLGPREKPSVLLTSDHGYRLDAGPRPGRRPPLRRRGAHPPPGPGAARHASSPPAPRRTGPTARRSPTDVDAARGAARRCGPARRTPTSPTSPRSPSSDRRSTSCGAAPRRTASSACSRSVTTRSSWPPPSRPPPGTRCEERVWALHALALARSGRQAESLAALRHIRRVLADELGLDPGQELRDLEQAVLVQDPVLQQWLRAEVTAAPRRRQPPAPPPAPSGTTTGWGTVGRDARGGRARAACSTARRRATPAYALLVGEPGIGKSRLVERLIETAGERGFVVATGRCAQDDGAPPLWPWSQASATSGVARRPAARRRGRAPAERGRRTARRVSESAERQAFRAWESIAHEVLTRSEADPAPARARGPALGRHRQPAGAAAAGRVAPRPASGWPSSPPAAPSRSRPGHWPTSARSWHGGTWSGSTSAA